MAAPAEKSEDRRPKFEGSPKSEIRSQCAGVRFMWSPLFILNTPTAHELWHPLSPVLSPCFAWEEGGEDNGRLMGRRRAFGLRGVRFGPWRTARSDGFGAAQGPPGDGKAGDDHEQGGGHWMEQPCRGQGHADSVVGCGKEQIGANRALHPPAARPHRWQRFPMFRRPIRRGRLLRRTLGEPIAMTGALQLSQNQE